MRKSLWVCLLLLLLTAFSSCAKLTSIARLPLDQQLLLVSDDDDNKFLGCLNCSEYDADSICNLYGEYGSKYGDTIWKEFGTYGNEYSAYSPWNEYSDSGPKIVDRDGNLYGRFSINEWSGFSLPSRSFDASDLQAIFEILDGDLDEVRDVFCDAIS